MDLFPRMIDLIRNYADEHSFERFIADVGEAPDVIEISPETVIWCFRDQGFHFEFMNPHKETRKFLWLIWINCNVPPEWGIELPMYRGFNPFASALPEGIELSDNRIAVRTKLRSLPVSATRIQTPRLTPEFSDEVMAEYGAWMSGDRSEPLHNAFTEYTDRADAEPDTQLSECFDIGTLSLDFRYSMDDDSLLCLFVSRND